MSSYYGLSHIIRECLDEKAKVISTARGKSTDAKLDIYNNSWQSLNTWIESKLAKQKGAGIAGFGCFCWELKQRDGATHCRPLFILSDQFVKSFKIRQERIHHPPQTTSVEEVNYSLLAIKYSKKLTKDMVFSGIRDILRKMGDFIYRGYELEIQFTFGTLRAKDRRVKFEFNQIRLQQILPEREPGILAYDLSAMAYVDEEDEADFGDNEGSMPSARTNNQQATNSTASSAADNRRSSTAIPSLSLSQKGFPPLARSASTAVSYVTAGGGDSSRQQYQEQYGTQPPTSSTFNMSAFNKISFGDNNNSNTYTAGSDSPSASATAGSNQFADTTANNMNNSNTAAMGKTFAEFEAEANRRETLPTDLRELLDTLANKQNALSKKEFRQKAKERVAEQAYLRCLDTVDDHARLDDNTLHQSTTSYNEWKDGILKQKQDLRDQVRHMKSTLDEQVARNNERAEREKQDKKNIIMKFILPDNAGLAGATIGPDGKVINSRQRINSEIVEQIQSNTLSKERTRDDLLNKERDYLKRLSLEIDLHNVVERSNHLQTQKGLLEAWERDGHIRNLRKLQPHGRTSVQDYIDTNLADTVSGLTINRPSTSIGGAINKSIGYDPRRGRVV